MCGNHKKASSELPIEAASGQRQYCQPQTTKPSPAPLVSYKASLKHAAFILPSWKVKTKEGFMRSLLSWSQNHTQKTVNILKIKASCHSLELLEKVKKKKKYVNRTSVTTVYNNWSPCRGEKIAQVNLSSDWLTITNLTETIRRNKHLFPANRTSNFSVNDLPEKQQRNCCKISGGHSKNIKNWSNEFFERKWASTKSLEFIKGTVGLHWKAHLESKCDPNYLSWPKKIMKFILRVLSLFGEWNKTLSWFRRLWKTCT